jgi:hypothetical protein
MSLCSRNRKTRSSLRPIVISIGSPCSAQATFLHETESSCRKIGILCKVFGPLRTVVVVCKPSTPEHLVSFDAVSLITNVPVDEALQVIRNKLHKYTLAERSVLQVEAIMELLEICLKTQIFRWTTSDFKKKMTLLWESLYHPSLATSSWSILRNWHWTRHNINNCCDSGMIITSLWSDLMVKNGYRISTAISIV